jgi:hypothetical protein
MSRSIYWLIKKISIRIAILWVVASVLPPNHALAQTTFPIDLSISPSVVEFAVQPGKTVTQAFELKNNGTVPLQVTPQLRDFQADGPDGLARILPSLSFPYGELVNSEIKLDQPFTLQPGSSQQLVVSLAIPETAKQQDWYISLVAKTKPDLSGTIFTGSNTTAQGTIVAHMLLRITDDNKEPLSWKIDLQLPHFMDTLQKLTFKTEVTNLSRTYATPELNVAITDWRHQIVSQQEGLPERILAQSTRTIPAKQARKDDPRSFEGIPFTLNQPFPLGPYTVRASIANTTGEPTVVEQQVIAFPFSILTAIVVVAAIIGAFRIYKGRPDVLE